MHVLACTLSFDNASDGSKRIYVCIVGIEVMHEAWFHVSNRCYPVAKESFYTEVIPVKLAQLIDTLMQNEELLCSKL